MRKVKLYLAASMALAALSFGGQATAATNPVKSLTITPSTIQTVIKPGASTHGDFQVLNQGQVDYIVHIYAAPYFVQGEDYTPNFSPLPGRPDVTKWFNFSIAQQTVAKTKSLSVNYTINVPAGTPAGGYYAVAFAETHAPKPEQGVLVNERVGEIFYIRVAGPIKQAGKVTSWTSSFLQKSPLAAILRLEDSGGLHYQSNVQLVVRDIFGNPKYTLTTQKEILPQTIRKIPLSWDKAPAFGFFKITGSATVVGKAQSLPTKYVLVMSQTVRLVLLIILVIIVLLVMIRFVLKRRQKRQKVV